MPLNVPETITVACLYKEIYFFEGGTSRVLHIDINGKKLVPASSRQHKCLQFGIYGANANIYLCGDERNSRKGKVAICEKYKIGSDAWTCLPSMKHERYDFIPVPCGQILYLPCASLPLETFSLTSETFSELPIAIASCQKIQSYQLYELIILSDSV